MGIELRNADIALVSSNMMRSVLAPTERFVNYAVGRRFEDQSELPEGRRWLCPVMRSSP